MPFFCAIKPPLGRFDRIFVCADAIHVDVGQAVLRTGYAFCGGRFEIPDGLRFVLRQAEAFEQQHGVIVLGGSKTFFGGARQPAGGFHRVRLGAGAGLIERRDIVLGLRDAFFGGVADVLEGARRVLWFAVAFQKQNAEIVVGFGVAGQRRLFEHAGGGLAIFLDAAPLGQHQAKRECALHVAFFGGPRVPVDGCLFVFRNAEAFGMNAGNQRVRLRFAGAAAASASFKAVRYWP